MNREEAEFDHCIFCGAVTRHSDCCETCWEMEVEEREREAIDQ